MVDDSDECRQREIPSTESNGRRQFLATLGAASLSVVAGCGSDADPTATDPDDAGSESTPTPTDVGSEPTPTPTETPTPSPTSTPTATPTPTETPSPSPTPTPTSTPTPTPDRTVVFDQEITAEYDFSVYYALDEPSVVSVEFETSTEFDIDVYTQPQSGERNGHEPLDDPVEELTFFETQSGGAAGELDADDWVTVFDNTATGEAAPPEEGAEMTVQIRVTFRN
jgi:outer membrane biosynthesis protein TonB